MGIIAVLLIIIGVVILAITFSSKQEELKPGDLSKWPNEKAF